MIARIQIIVACLIIAISAIAVAQSDDKAKDAVDAKKPATPADTKKAPTAKEIEDALRAKLKNTSEPRPAPANPTDTKKPAVNQTNQNSKQNGKQVGTSPKPAPVPPSAASVGRTVSPDPRIIGTAPGQRRPKLRREGEFLINRRGRLVSSGDAAQKMFVFDADSAAAPETPMLLLPCRLLENMEALAKDRGDRMVFQLSGQVFAYRGANYLLPTMMRPAINKGNLRN